MHVEDLENKGLIKRVEINFNQIVAALSRSKQDLKASRTNLSIDNAWSYAIAYHAMLRAGRSLMMSFGFRPITKDQHATIVRFTSIVLSNKYKDLTNKFDRMRRKRHDFVYEPNRPISRQEAEQAVADAEELVNKIWSIVKNKDPQEN